jgi:hypothetical protein
MHVMLDLETFGTRPGSALRSVGAVAFGLEGEIFAEFYRNIELESCIQAKLQIDPATLEWWEKQDKAAEAALAENPQPLLSVIEEFHFWFADQGGIYLWSHGAHFDEPLWNAAARAVGKQVPWRYWNVRCTRTLFALTKFDHRTVHREGVAHNALDDARHQVHCVQQAMRQLAAVV